MRRDGAYSIYKIQHQGEIKDEFDWHYSNMDHYGYPEGFNASGECWQQLGIHGVFIDELAIKGLRWIRERHPDTKFRLVLVFVAQVTRIVNVG